MSMNVIDISNYQATLNLEGVNYDGVAIKATEGTGYVNPSCDAHYQQAKAQGKKRAIYHFYDFGLDPVAQANYFVDNCIGYIKDAIFVLDWEGSGVANVSDALTFLKQVEARTGVKPAIYMSMWVENTYDWSAVVKNNNGLWLARYSNWELANHADNFDMSNAGQPPTVVHWPFYFMWQWTSTGYLSGYAGDLDCDIAYLSPAQWDLYAGAQATPVPTTTTTTTTTAPPPPTTTEPTTTPPTTTVSPTTTTTVAPTTTEAPTTTPNPTTSQPTEATTTEPTPVTTTQAPDSGSGDSWVVVIWSVVIAFIHQLQGKGKK
jgi:lysozyme